MPALVPLEITASPRSASVICLYLRRLAPRRAGCISVTPASTLAPVGWVGAPSTCPELCAWACPASCGGGLAFLVTSQTQIGRRLLSNCLCHGNPYSHRKFIVTSSSTSALRPRHRPFKAIESPLQPSVLQCFELSAPPLLVFSWMDNKDAGRVL